MNKSLASSFIAALIASAAFSSAANAERGDYYEGTSRPTTNRLSTAPSVDHYQTNSVSNGSQASRQTISSQGNDQTHLNRGDYYDGLQRPE